MILTCAFALLPTLVVATTTDQVVFEPYRNATPPILSVSADQWAALNTSVAGRLYPALPFSKPCFSRFEDTDVDVDEKACTQVRKTYRNEKIRTARFSGQINPQWEACQALEESCLLDYSDPFDEEAVRPPQTCHMGSISAFYIAVQEAQDVAAAFAFSRATRVPLVIKNTGHDYKGRSSAPFSLGLWTHGLQEISFSPDFVPQGCEAGAVRQPAVTLGAGVQWFQAYAFAQEHNVTLVGGADRTVGTTGGWLQGGGHGALTNTLGMGADRVLEFTAVTPDGITRTVNRCQNQDLFFALRGGGGGTFAVVLSATSLAAPRATLQAALVRFPTDSARQLWAVLVEHALQWAKEGWGAYINADSAVYVNPVLTKEEARQSMRPLVALAERSRAAEGNATQHAGNGEGVVVVQGEYDSWEHFYEKFADGDSADLGEPIAIASRLIPSSSFETPASREELLDALVEAQRIAPGVRILKTTPFNYPGEPGATAIHPAWRTAVFHVTAVATWNWNTTRVEVEDRYATVGRAMGGLRRITKGQDAAYVNEADVYEPNHEETFWGENYSRLFEIKNKYDPDRLLDCWHCVGWDKDSARFSCYV